MFPAELDPPTNAPNGLKNTFDQSAVTPPQSQDLAEAMDTGAASTLYTIRSGGDAEWIPQSDFARSAAEASHEPGSGWNNKKARDEYQRAMMQIEDKTFSLSIGKVNG